MTQHMLLFSIGLVQTFISKARKTRDLWLGSLLLSALMQISMEGIESKLIFPSKPFIKKTIPDLPNKYIAVFDNLPDAKAAAEQSEKKIAEFWLAICKDVWNAVLEDPLQKMPTNIRKVASELWENQIKPASLFEIFWVIAEGDIDHYPEWLTRTQLAFDGRKYLRNFQQQEESGEKSTISGLRSALRGSGELRSDVQNFWKGVVTAGKYSARDIDKDGAERLDAIDTVKRFAFHSNSLAQRLKKPGQPLETARPEADFPSTSSIAVAPFLERLILASMTNDPQHATVINKWINESRRLGE